MSEFTTVIAALKGQVDTGTQVTVKGWLRSKRDSKAGISFLAVHDGTAFDAIQAVVPNSLDNYESDVLKLSTGCAVEISGELVASQGKGQSVEIQASEVIVVGWVDDAESYPIAKKRHTFEYLRTQAHLRPRTNTFGAITRVRTTLANAIHNYFHDNGFNWINTPVITGSDCEGAGELFRVSTLDMTNLPLNDKGARGLQPRLFPQRGLPYGLRATGSGVLLPGHEQGVYLRPDLPRGELPHQPPPGRVLDGRTGDRLCRPQ